MGFRFRKKIKIAPGVSINVTQKGVSSASIGGKGVTLNVGAKGTKLTTSIPNTGISYSQSLSNNQKTTDVVDIPVEQRPNKLPSKFVIIFFVFFMLLIAVYALAG